MRNVTDFDSLQSAWRRACSRLSAALHEVPAPGSSRALMLVELGAAGHKPSVHITSGVHGDEPAGPWALLSIVESGLLDPRFAYRIWPCINPSGYRLGTRANAEGDDVNRSFSQGATTPESSAIMSRNRDRAFVLAIDLHEDFEAEGFYCYEPVIDGSAPLSDAVLRAFDDAGFPLQPLDHLFDLGYPPQPEIAARMRTLERGRVLVNAGIGRRIFPGLPQSLYQIRSGTRRTITMETPRTRPWEERIAMHRLAVTVALAEAAMLEANRTTRNA